MFEPFRALIGPPAEHRWQRLRPVMVIERRQVPPAIITAGELHHAGHQHQFKKEQLEQKQRGARDWRFLSALLPKLPWREEDRQETGLEQQDVPLKTKEGLSGNGQPEIKNEEGVQTHRPHNSK